MGKKRKAEVDIDSERTLYSSFVSAANTVSQLYTQALQQQRKAGAAASRQTLERVLCFLLKEYSNADVVPKAALVQFLQQEYEFTEGSEHAPHQYPAQFLPPVSQGTATPSGGHEETAAESHHKAARAAQHSPGAQGPSPARRGNHHYHAGAAGGAAAANAAAAMDTAEQCGGMDVSHGSGFHGVQQVQANPGFSFVGGFGTEPKGFGTGFHPY